jgi:hypothetical protein
MNLEFYRRKLWECLTSFAKFQSWKEVEPYIKNWWTSYKDWEVRVETFNAAFQEDRMSLRTFGEKFDEQRIKSIGLTGPFNLDSEDTTNRFFQDKDYTAVPSGTERKKAVQTFDRDAKVARMQFSHDGPGTVKAPGAYWAHRAIESSAFADPANFATSESKYDAGLHDLSASLMNHTIPIFDQIHNTEDGAHFSFMPLAKEEDQRMIYTLIRMAKTMKPHWPEMYALIRTYRAQMTRVKLAQNYDMGVGYIAIRVANPGPKDRKFKLRYGLVTNLTVPTDVDPSGSIKVTPEVYHGRQQAALNYTGILTRNGKNEIVIALRQHAGKFPVYAQRHGKVLDCYDIVAGKQIFNGRSISANGAMTPP